MKKNFESFTCVTWPHFKSNGLNCDPNSIIKYLVSYIYFYLNSIEEFVHFFSANWLGAFSHHYRNNLINYIVSYLLLWLYKLVYFDY